MTRAPIGILVRRFPKLSETFILSEILALEALGWPVTLFTLAPPTDSIVHADVAKVRAEIVRIDGHRPHRTLARHLRARGIRHLHAHFAGTPATLARKAAHTAGIGYSLSAHAKDIYLTATAALKANLAAARFVVTCTCYNAQHLRAVAPGVPVAKLYHGIDCAALCACAPADATARPLILAVGRLRAKKGFDTLVDACARLKSRGRPFTCEIIGYGPEEAALQAQIDARGLADDVTLSGKMPHNAVIARMRTAAAFAMPCRVDADGDRDGIPNVILEAMAVGVPVVSTPVSGVPEIISHGLTGYLVLPDDDAALAAQLEDMLARPEAQADIITAARRSVTARFGEGRDIAALDTLLRGTITTDAPGIGYVIKGFPRLSESFISAEVLRLERLGKRLTVFAMARGDALAECILTDMTSPLAYLPHAGSARHDSLFRWLRTVLPAYAPAHWRLARRRPRAWLGTFWQTLRFSRQYRSAGSRFAKRTYFKQFAQAGAIAESLPRAGITHLHGHFCHSATTITWMAAQLAGCSFSFTAHAKDIYQAKHNPGDLLQRKIAAATFVTTCTHANHAHLCDRLGSLPSLHTVYHGLDTHYFAPVTRLPRQQPSIIAVGRHVEKKGFDLLIAALQALRARGMIAECRIIGESGPATAALQQQIAAAGLQQQVRLEPPEPHATLRRSYAEADIFVLPCRIDDSGDRDGIPNVLAEAMATGLAVLSTHVSGIPELVHHEDNGLLVPADRVDALTDAIERLMTDAPLRARLGAQAIATIHEHFDADKTILDMAQLFTQAQQVAR